MKAAPGAGGIEVGDRRYLPDADGEMHVDRAHVEHAKASGYVEVVDARARPERAVKSAPSADAGVQPVAEPEPSEPTAAVE